MSHDAHTFNVCGEMMSGMQDSLKLKLALQPVGNSRRSVASKSPISRRLVAEDLCIHEIRRPADRRPIGDSSATDL